MLGDHQRAAGPASTWDLAPNTYTGPFPFVFQLEVEERRGNPDVGSEQAETYTLGAVFERESWSGSIDFYTIDIKGAIAPPDAYFVYNRCFNGAGTNPSYSIDDPEGFCRLIVRDPISGYRVQVNALYRNLGALETDGVDLQFNWRGDVGDNGMFVNFLVSYVNSYKLQQQPGGAFTEYAGTLGAGGQFDYRTFTTVGYDFGDNVNLGLRWTHLPEVENAVFATNPATTVATDELLRPFRLVRRLVDPRQHAAQVRRRQPARRGSGDRRCQPGPDQRHGTDEHGLLRHSWPPLLRGREVQLLGDVECDGERLPASFW